MNHNSYVYDEYKNLLDPERLGWIDGLRYCLNYIDCSSDRPYNDISEYAHGFDKAVEAFGVDKDEEARTLLNDMLEAADNDYKEMVKVGYYFLRSVGRYEPAHYINGIEYVCWGHTKTRGGNHWFPKGHNPNLKKG